MKTIITVVGKDKRGIIAKISAKLFELDINILDVSQTIMEDNFTMIMLVDMSAVTVPFDQVKASLTDVGNEIQMKINFQREEIFNAMHRV